MSRAPTTFGDVLRQLRTAASLSQEELAERAGVSLGVGHPVHPEDRVAYERTLAAARSGLGPAGFSAAWAEGRALSADEAAAEALAVGAELAVRADGGRAEPCGTEPTRDAPRTG